jgi:gluconate 5-dehydrogenase
MSRGLFDLSGRVALVTGGSRGLGLQIAEGLGEFGARIFVAARKKAEIDEAVARLKGKGIEAAGFVTDLSGGREAADALCAEVLGAAGRLDILVNAAGVAWGARAEDHPVEGWNKVMALNVTGLFEITAAAARAAFLPQREGCVVNLASIEGMFGHSPERIGTIAYNTSKGAVINMTRALAVEWGDRNVRVNAIAPGYFPSKMTREVLAEHGETIRSQTPLQRLGGDQDLKGAALLLASDAGRHITGQTIVVDGGFVLL